MTPWQQQSTNAGRSGLLFFRARKPSAGASATNVDRDPDTSLVLFLGDEWEGREERGIPLRLRYQWSEAEARTGDAAAPAALRARGEPTVGQDLAADHVANSFLRSRVRR